MPPKKGHFILHSSVLPPVVAGRYEFVSKVAGMPFATRAERTQVTVAAPRYTMPTDQILSSYPPANGDGAFGDRLPQIVLKRRTLPWERNPAGGTTVSTTPWLALVVVAEGEAELSTPTPVAQCVTDGVTLGASDKDVDSSLHLAVTQSVVDKIFPTEEDLPLLVHVREVDVTDTELASGDDDGWLAVVLANRLPVMDVATGKPVRYLACLVNLEGQLASLPAPSPPNDFFEFALAEDWRFLATESTAPDHIAMGTGTGVTSVSVLGADAPRATGFASKTSPLLGAALDGAASQVEVAQGKQWVTAAESVASAAADPDAQRLVRDTMGQGWRYPISKFALDPVLKFPVLAHWSFTTSEGATFETLMQGLDVGLLGTLEGERRMPPADPEAGPRPEDPPRPEKGEVIETGHIHLDHRTRRGDRTRSWYRGPLVPHPTLRDRPVDGKLPIAHSADQLRRFVPDGGEDLSYAAAFEIGRLVALSQLSIVSALLRFRGEQFGRERARQIADAFVPFKDLLTRAGPDLSRFVSRTLVESLATKPGVTMGPVRPIVDPGRPVDLRADLDTVIATGLGLDLGALRKTGEKVGMAAALAATTVPVASQDRGGLDEAQISMLQESLSARLADAVAIAVPQRVHDARGRPMARGAQAPQAPQAPDPLDTLIEGAPEHADPDPNEP